MARDNPQLDDKARQLLEANKAVAEMIRESHIVRAVCERLPELSCGELKTYLAMTEVCGYGPFDKERLEDFAQMFGQAPLSKARYQGIYAAVVDSNTDSVNE